jgi:hypothetical protein
LSKVKKILCLERWRLPCCLPSTRSAQPRKASRPRRGNLIFRQAQSAPPSLPEFKGNVVAVPTAPCWGDDLAALHVRWDNLNWRINQESKKDPSLAPAAKNPDRTRIGVRLTLCTLTSSFSVAL